MPRVSVIIPAYNCAGTIGQALASAAGQTFSDLEVLVVDDGSTDGTGDIARSFADPRVRVTRFPNGGLSAARNRGVRESLGELIAFLDGDDAWTADKLELQVAALDAEPAAGVAYSWTLVVDKAGRYLFPYEPVRAEGNVYPDLLVSCFVASGSNALVRRALLDDVGPFDEALRSCEDWEFWLRAAPRWPFVLVPRYQVLYRLSTGSLSSNLDAIERDNRLVVERSFQRAPAELQPLKPAALANVDGYLAFLYLSRQPHGDWRRRALAHAREAVRHSPGGLRRGQIRRVLGLSLLVRLAPGPLGPRLVHGALRLRGRMARKWLRAYGDPFAVDARRS
jgi:glycosyltransferase involved in cell wall biosynthesis